MECTEKLTYLCRHKCKNCSLYTCLKHRYLDSHQCKKKDQPVN